MRGANFTSSLELELLDPRINEVDRVQVGVEGDLLGTVLEALLAEPLASKDGPAAGRKQPPVAQAKLRESVAVAHPVEPGVLADTNEIAGRLQHRQGHMYRLEQPAGVQRASLRASRGSVLTRSPGRCGTNPGATTAHSIPRPTR